MTEISEPNETFFNSQPDSAEIRRLTLVGVGSCMAYLHGDKSPSTIAELLGATSALRQWGVSENMHAKTDEVSPEEIATHRSTIMRNPRLAAEFVAGALLAYLQKVGQLSGPDRAVLNEHDELDENQRVMARGQMRMIDMETAPAPVREYRIQFGMLATLMSMLDYEGERPHDEALASGAPYRHHLLNEG